MPMGWVAAVDVVQTVARHLVFGEAGVPREYEVSKGAALPSSGVHAFVYLDGLDLVRKIKRAFVKLLSGKPSEEFVRFEAACGRLGLALNLGKRLVGAVESGLLGGVIDGNAGTLELGDEKCMKVIWRG